MKEKATVALVRCENYNQEEVLVAVEKGLTLIGGVGQFAKKGEKILIKPNILVGDNPDRCVSPHPLVFKAIANAFKNVGANLSYGDSPGFGNPRGNARKAGFQEIADEMEIPFADFENAVTLSNPDGKLVNKFEIAQGVADSDGLVSISKLKTHALTRITGAIKNQFGCIPGPRKAEFHSVLPNALQFSKMLVDLNLLLKPRLYIMDGIMAMEGNGPRNGNPRAMNVLLFSTDPVALDSVVCKLVDLNPKLVETLVVGEEFGLGTAHDINIVGDPVEDFINLDFDVNRSPASTTTSTSFLSTGFMRRYSAPRPTIKPEVCTSCGTCVKVCPAEPKALTWADENHKKPPIYDYAKCIRCYCCQEMCPENAIFVKIPLLGKIIHR
ncbi:MAG: DUF362 domain-containing protein [Pelolinea sp.]|nr:DUF362 domain-containing protein [Pelolinea sp.]